MDQTNTNTNKGKWKQLSEKDRYKIEALSEQGLTPALIGAILIPKRDRRTIEREIARGTVEQKRINPSNSKNINQPMYITQKIYLADVGQNKHDENSINKGRNLKIECDHKLATHIENKIKVNKWSPDTIIGRIALDSLKFDTNICTKTLYNYIDRGLFLEITNKNLWDKKVGKKKIIKKFTRLR